MPGRDRIVAARLPFAKVGDGCSISRPFYNGRQNASSRSIGRAPQSLGHEGLARFYSGEATIPRPRDRVLASSNDPSRKAMSLARAAVVTCETRLPSAHD
jgi:hypothetical protein